MDRPITAGGELELSSEASAAAPAASRAPEPTTAALWKELQGERQVWLERMLRAVAGSLCFAGGFAFFWFSIVPNSARRLLPALLLFTLVAGTTAFASRFALRLRVWVLLATLFLVCSHATLLAGHTANATLGMATLVLLATLLVGPRAGLAAVAVTSLTLLGVSVLLHAGLWSRVPNWAWEQDSARLAVGVRVSGIFALLSATLVGGISYLQNRADELWLAKAQSLLRLRQEQDERERMARDLERRELSLRKARELELLGRLAGSMAHDFNNCLLVIFGALDELALHTPPSEPALRSLEELRSAADQARSATRQLRAFVPTTPESCTTLELRSVVNKASSTLRRVLPQNVALSVEVALDATIAAREGDLLRVLTNLALNARDAMPEGGQLTLRVRAPRAEEASADSSSQSCVAIEVTDTGAGMSDEVKERLFEPFFTTKRAAGTGLGLASVRDVVHGYGGQVRVDSRLGEGTSLLLLWPTAPAQPQSAAVPAPVPARPPVVLLVEDDPGVREVMRRGLARAGMNVLEAPDGAAGVIAARRHAVAIDVLCTDCMMQGLPVPQLIDQFRKLHHGRVLVCSGYAPAETGLSSEMYDDFLVKPFASDDLVRRIHALMA